MIPHPPMKYDLILTTAIAAELTASGLLTAAVYPHGSLVEKATPCLGVTSEEPSTPHPKMHRGNLVLIYQIDADTTPLTDAAEDLAAATDHLQSPAGRTAIRAAIAVDGLWLRILGPVSSTNQLATGDRGKTIEIRMPYWLQSAF